MARLSADPLGKVDRMVEIDEIGQVVYARPLDRAVRAEALAHRLQIGALQPDLRVAVHARLDRRNPREGRLLDGRMAVAAVDADRADVVRVRELDRLLARDGLLRRVRGGLQLIEDPEGEGEEEDRPENRDSRDRVGRAVEDLRHESAAAPA